MQTPWSSMTKVCKGRMGPCGSQCGNQSCQHHASSSCADLCSIHVQLQPVCITALMHSAFDVIQLHKCVGRVLQRGPIFLSPKFQTLRSGMRLARLRRPNSHRVELNVGTIVLVSKHN
jgi:hypothetical protein